MQSAPPAYRADIDGLRAISVLLVLLFHGFPQWLTGGYIGVDVFFVISGYLITTQIHTSTKANAFSFTEFYARRIRRIFPPLIAVLLFTAIYGYFQFSLTDFNALFRHIAAATIFVSNFALWQEAGYFDQQSELKPLLHLWSLAIEEQFYLLWPLLLAAGAMATRKFHNAVAWTLFLLCLGSFAVQVQLALKDSVAAFYSPLARFWELGVGGLLAVLQIEDKTKKLRLSPRAQDIAALLSCLCLLGCAVTFSKKMPLPGVMNALPALCAIVIIATGPAAAINRRLLASRPLVQLGLVSYALYLWHWPLLSFMRIEGAGSDSPLLIVTLLGASVVFAFLTRALLEQPIRRSHLRGTPVFLAVTFACLGIASVFMFRGGMQPPRLAQQVQIREQVATAIRAFSADGVDGVDGVASSECDSVIAPQSARPLYHCRLWGKANASRTVVVWGDSMSMVWMSAFITLVRDEGWRIVQFSHAGCPPLTGVHRTDIDIGCSSPALQTQIAEAIRAAKPDVIFLIARWNLYYHGHIKNDRLVEKTFITDRTGEATHASAKIAFERHMPAMVRQLTAIARVVVFRDTPVLKVPVDIGMTTRPDTFEPSLDEFRHFEADINRVIDIAIAQSPTASVFDPSHRLCGTAKCGAFMEGLPAYIDEVHLTPHAVLKFVADIQLLGAAR